LSALGSRILLAGFSSSTSFLPVGKFFFRTLGSSAFRFRRRCVRGAKELSGELRLAPLRSRSSLRWLTAVSQARQQIRCSSVPVPSGFRYPVRGPPGPPNVRATFSWLSSLRQGVQSLFFSPNSTSYEVDLDRTDQGSVRPFSEVPASRMCHPHVEARGRAPGFTPSGPELGGAVPLGKTEVLRRLSPAGRFRRPAGGPRKLVREAPLSNRKMAAVCAFVGIGQNC
jgi:hypothetical protein